MNRIKVEVTPALSKENRKALSAYIQALKQERPRYFTHAFTFEYRGSMVKVTPPHVNVEPTQEAE